MSILFTAACTNGRVTSLGPLPTHTIVPPGFVEYIPVHKLKYQKEINASIRKVMIVLKNPETKPRWNRIRDCILP